MLNLDINKPDLPYVFHLLVPGFKFEGYFPDNWEWTDERPQPTEKEVKKVWRKFVKSQRPSLFNRFFHRRR